MSKRTTRLWLDRLDAAEGWAYLTREEGGEGETVLECEASLLPDGVAECDWVRVTVESE